MRVARGSSALLCLLTGCESLSVFLEEQRTLPTEIYWTGTVLDGPYAEDVGYFTGGAITATDHAGDALVSVAGEELDAPYEVEGDPGTWVLTVPVHTEILLRLSGDGFANTVWSTDTPDGRAYWFTGALFARSIEDLDATFAAYVEAGLLGALPQDLAQGAVVHLWAEPLEPEAWAGAEIHLTDGSGAEVPVVRITADDEGQLGLAGADDPVSQLFAFDLTPGDVILEVTTADGRGLTESWPTLGGDLLNASFLGLSDATGADGADTAQGD